MSTKPRITKETFTKLKQLHELSLRGVGGEKENARAAFLRLLAKHGISETAFEAYLKAHGGEPAPKESKAKGAGRTTRQEHDWTTEAEDPEDEDDEPVVSFGSSLEEVEMTGSGERHISRGPEDSYRAEEGATVRHNARLRHMSIGGWGDVFIRCRTGFSVLRKSGSGDLTVEGFKFEHHVEFHLSGSGNVYIRGEARFAEIHISGTCDLSLSGFRCERLNIFASGQCDVSHGVADHVTIRASGQADVGVRADKSVRITAVGQSEVTVRGNPATVHRSVSGQAEVFVGW